MLEVPSRLWVPIATRPSSVEFDLSSADRIVVPGDLLTKSVSELEPAALAPAAGRVAGARRATLANGVEVPAVQVETSEPAASNDSDSETDAVRDESQSIEEAAEAERIGALIDAAVPEKLPAQIDALRRAGVWADRWTSPDLLGQLHQCLRRPVDTVICNVLDADPSLPVNAASAEAFGAALVAGVGVLGRLVGAPRVWIAVDESYPPSRWDGVRDAAAEAANDLRIVPLANDYPQADPSLLLYTLSHRKLRPGRLPTECGALLLDAAAAVAVGRALLDGEPMLRVPLAVYDQSRDAGHLLSVAIGTPVRYVLEQLQMQAAGLALHVGGPLRERTITADAIVAGGELGIYALARPAAVSPDPCIRCGWCIEGCPVRIHPPGLLEAAQLEDANLARRYGLDSCIECGICTYVCPSRLPLLQAIRGMRVGDDRVKG